MAYGPIPAGDRRYPAGCPDPDWCRGNRSCYWDCRDYHEAEEALRFEAEAEERRRLENEEMERHFREHPHG